MPSLTALLADAPGQAARNEGPLLCAVNVDELQDHSVLLLAPGPLGQRGVQHFVPAVQALHLTFAIEMPRNGLPIAGLVTAHGALEDLVLWGGKEELSILASNLRV